MPSQLSEMTFSALFSVLKSPTQPPCPQLLACLPVSPGNRGSKREAHKLPGDTPPPLWSQVVSLATHHARPHLGLRVPCSPATRDTAPASLSWGASLPSPAPSHGMVSMPLLIRDKQSSQLHVPTGHHLFLCTPYSKVLRVLCICFSTSFLPASLPSPPAVATPLHQG